MQVKLGFILLALANAVILQRGLAGAGGAPWAISPPDPAAARKWAALGIAVLLTMITLGKLLAYIGGNEELFPCFTIFWTGSTTRPTPKDDGPGFPMGLSDR